jgi:hypothetical protein
LRVARALDASGASVVVLARAGQDLSRYRLRWSHLGWAYRDGRRPPARWRVLHKLNHCGSAEGALYRQGLGEFFLDDLHEYVAAYAVPTRWRCRRSCCRCCRTTAAWRSCTRRATTWWPTPGRRPTSRATSGRSRRWRWREEPRRHGTSRDRAQAWLRFKGYQPSTLRINALTRLGARVTR